VLTQKQPARTGSPLPQWADVRATPAFLVTESQNHRMFGVGRDLCGSPSPTLLLKQGHLQQAAEDLVQAGRMPRWFPSLKA